MKIELSREKVKKLSINCGLLTLGCLVYSFGIALFLDPNHLASGGVTGIAIILNFVFETYAGINWLNTGLLILILNVPLIILGAVFFGKKFIVSTLYSTVLSSLLIELWTFVFKDWLPLTANSLVAGIIGGAMMGAGLGIIFRMGSTTGGTDILVKILRKKFRYIRTGIISMAIDLVIICSSAIVFKDFELACYTVVSLMVLTMAFDFLLYGGNSAKLVYIITSSDKAEEIIEKILKDLDIGATYVDGKGAYTGSDRRIIFCAIKSFLYPKLRDVISASDPQAFTIVTSAKEIYGEGYKDHKDGDV